MKRWIWLALAAVPLAAAAITMVAVPKAPEWTTSSPQALEAYLAGEGALRKLYYEEALEHFKHSLEIDPDFLVAKWRIAQNLPGGYASYTGGIEPSEACPTRIRFVHGQSSLGWHLSPRRRLAPDLQGACGMP